MAKRELTSARIKYLVLLSLLDEKGKGIRSVEIANILHISRASVHVMIDRLSEAGYVEKEYYGIIYLTDKGKNVGEYYAADYPNISEMISKYQKSVQ